MRSIRQVINAPKVRMGDVYLHQPLPHPILDSLDPFLLIHHWYDVLPGNQSQRSVGVGPHPHRGFSPVTFIFKGGLHHRDSFGNDEVIYAGGTQWMNAGKGITHSERPAKELAENGGEFEVIQFWVNTPSESKMKMASYQSLTKENTPVFNFDDDLVSVYVVNGEFEGLRGNIQTSTESLILRLAITKGGEIVIPVPAYYNTLLYQLNGDSLINEKQELGTRQMCVFNNDGQSIKIKAKEDCRLILLSGKPLEEEVVAHGPFVMNSQVEIMEAMRDYQMGKMGILIEDF